MAKNKFENLSAGELAKKLGVSLALPAGPAAADPADPFALVRDLQRQGLLSTGAVTGVYRAGELGQCHYRLELAKPPLDAAKAAYAPREWMQRAMPSVAETVAWLRGWMPADLLGHAFVSLWAGRGYAVDEGAGLAMGSPPRDVWRLLSQRNEQGITRVERRQQ